MRLYHFTSEHHLHGIARFGLTVGDVPTDIHQWKGGCGVWLTSNEAARGHGLEGSSTDKSRYRLMVEIDGDDPALVKWTTWAAKRVTPGTIRVLHARAPGFDTWYVYFGVINPSAIEECVDMRTGEAVENWRDAPQSKLIKPVSPERRRAWHAKLMKKLRRNVSRLSLGKPPRPR